MWTQEQFQAWKTRKETKDFLSFLKERREVLKESWAEGDTPLSPHDQAAAQIFGDIINFDYERDVAPLYEDEEDDELSE